MGAGEQVLSNFQTYLVNPTIVVIFTAGLLVFMYGLTVFMYKMREGGDHKEGLKHMLWGIVGMFIMVSVWSIIKLIENTIGADPRNPDVTRLNATQPVGQIFK